MSGRQTIKQRIALDGGKEIRAELEALGAAGKKAFQQLQKAANDLKGPPPAFVKAMQDAQKQLKALGDSFRKTGEQFQKSGRTFSAFVTAPIIAGFGASVKAAVDFESAMADVRKVVDFPTPAAFEKMGKDISDMSLRLPIAADGLAAIAAAAGQAGIAAEDLTQFTELVAKASVAFELTAEEAGGALAKIKTALGLSIPEVELLSDALNQLANNAATSEADILDIVARVGALGKMSGVSVKEIAALGSAMVSMGVDSERAATGLRNILLRMQAGERATKEQQGAWKQLGLDSVQVARDIQRRGIGAILDVFERINKQAPTVRASIINALFGERVVDAAGPLIGNLKELRRQLALVQNEADYVGSTAREFGVRSETAANSLTLFVNQISALRREVGAELLPPLLKLVAVARDMVKGFSALSGETKRQIIGFGLVAAAVGPVLIAFGALLRSIAAITTAARVMFGVLLFARANPVVAGLTLVGSLIAGWAALTGEATAAMERHRDVVDSVAEAYRKAGGEVAKMAKEELDRELNKQIASAQELDAALETSISKWQQALRSKLVFTAKDSPFRQIMEDAANGIVPVQKFIDEVNRIGAIKPDFAEGAVGLTELSEETDRVAKKSREAHDWIDLLTRKISDAEFQATKTGESFRGMGGDLKNAGAAAADTMANVEDLGRKVTVTKFGDGGPVKQVYDLADGVARAVDTSKASLDDLEQSASKTGQTIRGVSSEVAGAIRSVPEAFQSDAATAAVDSVVADVDRIAPAAQQAASNVQTALGSMDAGSAAQAADAILRPFESLPSKIDEILAAIRNVAQGGFSALAATVRQMASEITTMINSIIAALRQAAAEASKLRATGSSSARAGGRGFSRGGRVWGAGTGTSDSIPAWLSNGEFVAREKAVSFYGPDVFHALNNLLLPRDFLKGLRGFNLGGMVDGIRSSLSSFNIPQFANGGFVEHALVAGGGGGAMKTFDLHLHTQGGTEIFRGLMSPAETATQLRKAVAVAGNVSAGRKPGWYK